MRKYKMDFWLCVGLAVVFVFAVACRAKAESNPLSGNYFGAATIDSPEGLGNVDLAFHLDFDATGNVVPASSYIILDKTILFPKTGQVGEEDVGPFMESGYFQNPAFQLVSQSFTNEVNGRSVNRKIRLEGNAANVLGNTISGTYTETMTGYLPNAIQVTGSFVLFRPAPMTKEPLGCQYLDTTEPIGELTLEEIRAGGIDPNVVEFEDLSCAMYYHQNPGEGISVNETTIRDAVLDYKAYLPEQP